MKHRIDAISSYVLLFRGISFIKIEHVRVRVCVVLCGRRSAGADADADADAGASASASCISGRMICIYLPGPTGERVRART